MIDFKSMTVGDEREYGVGEWKGNLQADFKQVVDYAAKNWPVQFELSTHWRPTERGVQECYYVLTRTR